MVIMRLKNKDAVEYTALHLGASKLRAVDSCFYTLHNGQVRCVFL